MSNCWLHVFPTCLWQTPETQCTSNWSHHPCSCISNVFLFLCVWSQRTAVALSWGLMLQTSARRLWLPSLVSDRLSCPVKSCQVYIQHLFLPISTVLSPSLYPVHSWTYFFSGLLTDLPDFSLYPYPFNTSLRLLADKLYIFKINTLLLKNLQRLPITAEYWFSDFIFQSRWVLS